MFDMFDVAFGSYLQGKVAGLDSLQANTDQRLTGTTDRLSALEQKYERTHLLLIALWALLKEHTSVTDAELKAQVQKLHDAAANKHPSATTLICENCHRINNKAATRCIWCGAPITTGSAFEGT